jgi:hypothetical protein
LRSAFGSGTVGRDAQKETRGGASEIERALDVFEHAERRYPKLLAQRDQIARELESVRQGHWT